MIHVGWPATFTGRRDKATGRFLAVVWKNLADPIITGRDEIGHPKLYDEIAAGWMGFRFLDVMVSCTSPQFYRRPNDYTERYVRFSLANRTIDTEARASPAR